MKYVVLFQRGDRTPNIDEWFDTQYDADKRKKELQRMFDWLNNKQTYETDPVSVWVECAEIC